MEDNGTHPSPWKTIITVAAIVAVVAGSDWLWDTVKYDLLPKRFGVVVEGLVYRSGHPSAAQVSKTLERNGIRLDIGLNGHNPDDPDHVAEQHVAETTLPDYLNSHMAELAGQLLQMGVIDGVPDPLPVLAPR